MPAADSPADPLAAIRHLPADNPYRKPLEKWLNLPEEERKALSSWAEVKKEGEAPAPPLTSGQSELIAGLTASLRSAARQQDAAVWPLVPNPAEPDNPMAIMVPHVGVMMSLGRLVTRGTESTQPRDAIETYAAVAQMGRQMRMGNALIDHLAGVAVEGIATAGAAKRLGEFSAADLDALHAAWAGLKAVPGTDQALRCERDTFFKPFLKHILKPGLAALLAEQAGLAETTPAARAGVGADLRVTAIINDGQRMIGMEDLANGRSFFVSEGKTVNEVTLVSIDFARNRAVLRIGGKDAIMDLASRRIVERQAAANRLLRTLGLADSFSPDQRGAADELIGRLVQRVQNHPGGLDDYIRQLESHYETALSDSLLRAEQPKFDASAKGTPPDDPLLAMLIPTFDGVARTLNRAELTVTMFNAAVALRSQELAGKPPAAAVDPWAKDGEKLHVDRNPDGGFILRSIYEGRDGKPVEYKFAAPDAGLIRRQPQ